jgi:signal transduction histidine kinase
VNLLKNKPIQQKLMVVMLLTSSVVLFLTCSAYFVYEYVTAKKTLIDQTVILARMCVANSTAALAFGNAADAEEVLSTLKVDPHIVSAVLYDADDSVFATYPPHLEVSALRNNEGREGFRFSESSLSGQIPVLHDNKRLGTLYITANMDPFYARFRLYVLIALAVITVSLIVSYLLSRFLQKNISAPILSLAETAKVISDEKDYRIRATKFDNDEIGSLTNAFNNMLSEIEKQNLEIISLNQNLEAKVRDRTQELEVAYGELESFSYTVSHDLNAPLRKIDLFIDQYQNKKEAVIDADGKTTLERITRYTSTMRQLIADLLTFSQLGKKDMVKAEVDMKEIVRNAFEDQLKLEEDRTIELKLDDIPNAVADEITIKQVWINLISNALKYSKNNRVTKIEISGRTTEESIVYCIKDNGVGFDMKFYHKLFSAFNRLHSAKDFDGTGVGLAIVHRIVTKHGGQIWAESTPDAGATFYFSVPK